MWVPIAVKDRMPPFKHLFVALSIGLLGTACSMFASVYWAKPSPTPIASGLIIMDDGYWSWTHYEGIGVSAVAVTRGPLMDLTAADQHRRGETSSTADLPSWVTLRAGSEEIRCYAYGWPWRAAQYQQERSINLSGQSNWHIRGGFSTNLWSSSTYVIPLNLYIRGLALCVSVFSAAYVVVYVSVSLGYRELLWRRGLCIHCRYPRGSGDVCTECGRPFMK
jgi:hypothetical protein